MGSQGCNDECSELIAQDTATKLFQTAALLLGNEAEAVNLVEETVASVEVDPCADAVKAQVLVQNRLVQAAIGRLSQREPESFAVAGDDHSGSASCIEGDDISAAGISPSQLAYLLEGEGRQQLRDWLEHLPVAQRIVFVERAMLGQDNVATAASFRAGGGIAGWTPDRVGEVFRQALCSLATSLIHSGAIAQAV
jgi:DNA-directed RNA polymerase specialized sigma24 family protein